MSVTGQATGAMVDRGQPATDLGTRLRLRTDQLLERTGASRTTVRARSGDDPVALLAESLAPGVPTMHGIPAEPAAIVAAPTYLVLAETKSILVQDDCRTQGPRPPESLTGHFRVRAQMLAPVLAGGEMIGTISVHQQDTPRHWTPADIAALEEVTAEVAALLTAGQSSALPISGRGDTLKHQPDLEQHGGTTQHE